VIENLGLNVCAITANSNAPLLEQQARKFSPKIAVCYDDGAAADLKVRLADTSVKVLSGMEGLIEAASMDEADTVLTAVMGMIGLQPTMAAIKAKKRIALANKETLVCAGSLVMKAAKDYGAEILPVDSEHSAIFQCLQGNDSRSLKRILLTASGGPFRGMTRSQLETVTKDDALKHPNWTMGPKITIDSATLMNKGLEFIEAMHLFSVTPEQIKVIVHPQSVIHSMVEYTDNSVIAQLGCPDMRLPIQYALTYPERKPCVAKELDFMELNALTFQEPDTENFPCLRLAMDMATRGKASCAVMNGANEVAVGLFLKDKIGFNRIYEAVEKVTAELWQLPADTIENILEADRAARELTESICI
jgi:1-deoxy-D-xylulose-5-phosphate reductoisomerase